MTLIGYARVSTSEQHTAQQESALAEAGCKRVFRETASGKMADRPELARALDRLEEGDTLVVWRLDRLGRSLAHLIATVNELHERGVGFRSIHENIDTTTSTGRLVFHIFGALAEFERDLIVDRTHAGLAAARASGKQPGRKPMLSAKQKATVRKLREAGSNVSEIAAMVKVSRATVYRALSESL
jgi:DNA invertase Pin-like site-specific DNA recombinase